MCFHFAILFFSGGFTPWQPSTAGNTVSFEHDKLMQVGGFPFSHKNWRCDVPAYYRAHGWEKWSRNLLIPFAADTPVYPGRSLVFSLALSLAECFQKAIEREREGGREGARERGREGERERGRERGREREREREGEREREEERERERERERRERERGVELEMYYIKLYIFVQLDVFGFGGGKRSLWTQRMTWKRSPLLCHRFIHDTGLVSPARWSQMCGAYIQKGRYRIASGEHVTTRPKGWIRV